MCENIIIKKSFSDFIRMFFYLTDVPQLMLQDGRRVETYSTYDTTEIFGVNTPEDLDYCEKILRRSEV